LGSGRLEYGSRIYIERAGSGARYRYVWIDSEGKLMSNHDPPEKQCEKSSSQYEISTESPTVRLQQEIKKIKINTVSTIIALGLLLVLVLIFPMRQILMNPGVILFFFSIGCLFFAVDKITKRISKYFSHVFYQICILLVIGPLTAYFLYWDWMSIGLTIWIIMTILLGSFEYFAYNQKLKAI
jgi:hypothetical protein